MPPSPTLARWRYSGKEEQQALSPDLSLLDYGARMYDPTERIEDLKEADLYVFDKVWIGADKMICHIQGIFLSLQPLKKRRW